MRRNRRVILVLASLASGVLNAQTQTPYAAPGMPADYQKMMAAYESAQANASRPGDDALSCETIEAEATSIVQDPLLQEYIASAGAAAQQDMATMQAAQAAMMTGVAPQPSMQQSQAQAMQRVQAQQRQMEQLIVLLPQLMRAQRLVELGVLKSCDWTTEVELPIMDFGVGMPSQ